MKQRLVGTLVLGSLALILIPLLLDGEGVERPPLSANIPPAPTFDTAPLPEPTRPDILADRFAPNANDSAAAADVEPALDEAPAVAEASPAAAAATASEPAGKADAEPGPAANTTTQAAESATTVASATAPALDASGLPETWTVRVGVFGNKANAERLMGRLAADEFKAFIRPVGVSSGVYLGPVATRDEAAALQQQVNAAKARYQIVDNAIVQRFDPGQE